MVLVSVEGKGSTKPASLTDLHGALPSQNLCFICNIERPEFDRQGNGFEHHIRHEHHCWHYINLMA